MPKRCEDVAAHFWGRTDQSAGPEGCWPWTGFVRRDGYGQTRVFGERRTTGAHQYAFLLSNGWVPSGRGRDDLLIRHKCDNKICCNPKHLETGTHAQNTADCINRGRWRYPQRPSGFAAYRSRLRPDQVTLIRERRAAGEALALIAKDCGVHLETARRALKGQTYAIRAAALDAKAQMDDVLRGVGS